MGPILSLIEGGGRGGGIRSELKTIVDSRLISAVCTQVHGRAAQSPIF